MGRTSNPTLSMEQMDVLKINGDDDDLYIYFSM